MISREIIEIFMAFLGSFGFAVLFNIKGKKLVTAAFGGLLSWLIFVLFSFISKNEPLIYFVASVMISCYSEIMARILKTPTTTFITTSLIPLVPGRSLYYTMENAFGGNLDKFLVNGINTLELAVALALGVVLVTAFVKLINKFFSNKKRTKYNILKKVSKKS